MTILQEGSLRFEFDNQWRAVCKYDDCHFYDNTVSRCQNIKAVDFIATKGDELLWIEVKDFRQHDLENRPRLSPQDPQEVIACRTFCENQPFYEQVKISRKKPFLGEEIAEKVRHTFLGLSGAWRHQDNELMPYIKDLGDTVPLKIVLFLQQDALLDDPREFKPVASSLKTKIEQQLSFLNVQVDVVNSLTLPTNAGWKVLP